MQEIELLEPGREFSLDELKITHGDVNTRDISRNLEADEGTTMLRVVSDRKSRHNRITQLDASFEREGEPAEYSLKLKRLLEKPNGDPKGHNGGRLSIAGDILRIIHPPPIWRSRLEGEIFPHSPRPLSADEEYLTQEWIHGKTFEELALGLHDKIQETDDPATISSTMQLLQTYHQAMMQTTINFQEFMGSELVATRMNAYSMYGPRPFTQDYVHKKLGSYLRKIMTKNVHERSMTEREGEGFIERILDPKNGFVRQMYMNLQPTTQYHGETRAQSIILGDGRAENFVLRESHLDATDLDEIVEGTVITEFDDAKCMNPSADLIILADPYFSTAATPDNMMYFYNEKVEDIDCLEPVDLQRWGWTGAFGFIRLARHAETVEEEKFYLEQLANCANYVGDNFKHLILDGIVEPRLSTITTG
ncbi:hypothetical protein ACFL1B_05310 [Nanoarchaeota archaeon]